MTDKLLQALDRVAELEDVLGLTAEVRFRALLNPARSRWSQQCEQLLGLLFKRNSVRREAAYSALYGARAEGEQPGVKTIDVYISLLRKALRPHGIAIATDWGIGHHMTAENKAKLRALIEAQT